MSRTGTVSRTTKETSVHVSLDLDAPQGIIEVSTGVGFFDHMLNQLGKHGAMDLTVRTEGDLHIDAHHTMEDTAIALGEAYRQALGDCRGVRRFADATVPLDEVLARAVVDLSGRPYVVHEEPLELAPTINTDYPTSMTRHILESFGHHARITLHVSVLRAANHGQRPDAHHVVEAQFKALARALRSASELDGLDEVPSTKGVL
ncbi:imidazoleglycerol-phosphate dehydratase HisB [Stackebrandtia nassauensis]|uniref:Imidazoleglycerol-phosphate dehydratase n=1 Tax=Stackebrandtia nassauensis (strain DSM 44728 / CIP 108903 / NRRL B-16338 / NBRC 102104 / LLR-40K-21) TaxID=446470 RepID=D3PZW0_STANL|nr:imidazoleglycerol-phosphate dehydratase HisB [Stackebrandtia nassauensis]ADD43647.1 Imidazoleglycerol-phosphate dehydratase [Stackebrandtia nassauensis DSM 44728]